MKKIKLLAFFLLLHLSLFAQSNEIALAGSSWSLQQDQMAGLGVHHSLEAGTTLKFVNDQWTASQAINGHSEGKWALDKKGRTVLYFGEKKRGFCRMEEGQLILLVPGVGKERMMTWKKTNGEG